MESGDGGIVGQKGAQSRLPSVVPLVQDRQQTDFRKQTATDHSRASGVLLEKI